MGRVLIALVNVVLAP